MRHLRNCTTSYEEFVQLSGCAQIGRVTRINFDTGMIETDPYPIADFVRESERPLKIVAPDDLATTMGAEWGTKWPDMLKIIKERTQDGH